MRRWIPRLLWMLTGMLAVWIWQHPNGLVVAARPQARIIAPAAAERAGSEPLSAAEQRTALLTALAARAPTDPARPLAVLLIERHDPGKQAGPRAADVYLYDYASDALWLLQVDLAARAVVATEQLRATQPPPTPAELQTALKLLLEHPGAAAALERAAGAPLTAAELRVSGISLGDRGITRQLPGCARHRCVQLFLDTLAGRGLNLAPVVDLSALQVVKEQ